jgi:hypothetical protein
LSFGKGKLLLSFALLGFLIGSSGYMGLSWLMANSYIQLPPFNELLLSNWFISGIIGSMLSILLVVTYAHFARQD